VSEFLVIGLNLVPGLPVRRRPNQSEIRRAAMGEIAFPGLVFCGCKRKFNRMKNDVVPIQIRGILPANSGCALFVGNDEKVFVINVEPQMGAVIGMFLRDTPKERPLTHDLINRMFQGFGINVERVIITDLKNSTYFARIILQQQNELARKIVELDARPSDCLALAAAQKKPIFVSASLFAQVEDMSKVLEQMNESGGELESE
jgi:bifunctional DNase/RNase